MSPRKPAKRARQEPKPGSEESTKRRAKDPKRSLEAIQQCCVCPITQALLVDPVVAADGNSYERDAIHKWLDGHNTSPVSKQPLTTKSLFSSVTLRQSVTELVESGAVQGEAAAQWHLASGKCKHTGALPGGESAARAHFEAAAELGSEAAAAVLQMLNALNAAREAQVDVSWLVPRQKPARPLGGTRTRTAVSGTPSGFEPFFELLRDLPPAETGLPREVSAYPAREARV